MKTEAQTFWSTRCLIWARSSREAKAQDLRDLQRGVLHVVLCLTCRAMVWNPPSQYDAQVLAALAAVPASAWVALRPHLRTRQIHAHSVQDAWV